MGMQQTTLILDTASEVEAQLVKHSAVPASDLRLDEKVAIAITAIKAQVLAGRHLAVAWSGGKDSSVTLAITLLAVRELMSEGVQVPTVHVVHSNTLMENPVVESYNERQIEQIERYSRENGIPLRVWIASPGLSNDYLVSIIGGRSIISVGNNTKCQQMTKASPLDRLKRQIRKSVAEQTGKPTKQIEVISLIGTRFDESATRGRAMQERGESATDAVEVMEGSGQMVLSPIANFTQMDVFEFIGNVRSGRIEGYDTWDDLVGLYRSINSGDCMVTAYLAGKDQSKAPCNARTGCWTCARVSRDTSTESLIATEGDQFAWLKPLNDLRAYLIKRHFDPSARAWLARDVDEDGYIQIAPNAYSPQFTKELLGIVLSIQADEQIAARKLGIKPRFKLLTLKQVMAIELSWGRYGYQQPWEALRTYLAVYREGKRFRIPDMDSIPAFTERDVSFRARVPFADGQFNGLFSGLRNVEWAAADCEDLTLTRSGQYMTRVEIGNEYDIDDEGLANFMEFDLDYALNRIQLNDAPSGAVHYLLGLGTVQLFKGSHSDWDRMLRISNQLFRHGLQPILHDPHAIIAHLNAKRAALGLQADSKPSSVVPCQGDLF